MENYSNFQKNQRAVAIGYEKDTDEAPRVLAIGKGEIANQIIDIAKSHNIPIHHNIELAKTLSLLEINSYIPVEVYGTVAKILLYIYQQEKLAKDRKKLRR